MPSFLPKCGLYESNEQHVRMMDQRGGIVSLPLDLRVNLALTLSKISFRLPVFPKDSHMRRKRQKQRKNLVLGKVLKNIGAIQEHCSNKFLREIKIFCIFILSTKCVT